MNNAFQEQLLKAGIVNQQQVKKVNQEKLKNKKQNRNKKISQADRSPSKAQLAAEKKAQRDRELNQKKQEQARKRAISAEIDQLIRLNLIKRDKECDQVYQFEHRKKVIRIYVNQQMKSQLLEGKLGIARIEGLYELVPIVIAEKIKQRNDQRIVFVKTKVRQKVEDDPYADYQIPDDITW